MSVLLPISWRGESVSRIILGAAQLGMGYGIANTQGKPDAARARAIVEAAWEAGVRYFDTAQAYGDSESVLGTALRELGVNGEACVTSKLAVHDGLLDLANLDVSIDQTFERQGVDRLWCLMLHDARGLAQWDDGLGEALLRYRDTGRIQHLGVSLSPLADAPRCLAHPHMEVVQLPCNAWDQRPLQRGILSAAKEGGRLRCVRSVYLQGLLTLSPEAVATRLPVAVDASRRWHAFAEQQGLSPLELAMRFGVTLDVPLVVGAETPGQLRETIALVRRGPLPRELVVALAKAMAPTLEDSILEPWKWPRG